MDWVRKRLLSIQADSNIREPNHRRRCIARPGPQPEQVVNVHQAGRLGCWRLDDRSSRVDEDIALRKLNTSYLPKVRRDRRPARFEAVHISCPRVQARGVRPPDLQSEHLGEGYLVLVTQPSLRVQY